MVGGAFTVAVGTWAGDATLEGVKHGIATLGFDLRGTWTSATGRGVVAGFVHNAFDKIGIRQILRHGATDGFRRTAQVTEPRLVGLEVSFSL